MEISHVAPRHCRFLLRELKVKLDVNSGYSGARAIFHTTQGQLFPLFIKRILLFHEDENQTSQTLSQEAFRLHKYRTAHQSQLEIPAGLLQNVKLQSSVNAATACLQTKTGNPITLPNQWRLQHCSGL